MSPSSPITPAGYQRYEEELQRLWREDRPKIVNEVADAAALGDRSDNAEYRYGKQKLREIDRRMRYLSELLDRLKVIDPAKVDSDRVQFGATVDYEDEEGVKRTYQLVGVDEVDVSQGQVSIKSPIGRALMGKQVGDFATIKRPRGDLEIEITRIAYV